jgi:hypothetical protein
MACLWCAIGIECPKGNVPRAVAYSWEELAVEAVMARKKTSPKVEQRIRVAVTAIRSMPEWKDWLGEFADAQRKDVSDLVDEALLRMARAEGFRLPPKR